MTNKKFGKNIFLTLSRQIISAFLQLGSVILIARLLGAEGMGEYSLAILIPQFLISILNLGLPSSLVYFIASNKYTLSQSLYWLNRFFAIFIPSVLLAVLCLFYFFHEVWFPDLSFFLITLAIFSIPFMLIQVIQISLFQALEDFKKFNFLTLIQPIVFLTGILFLWLIGRVLTEWVVVVFLVSQISVWWFTKTNLDRLLVTPAKKDTEQKGFLYDNFKYGLKAYFANISSMISYRADLYLVGLLMTASSAGIYAIALQISERLFIISQAVSTVLLPRLSGLNESPDQQTQLTSIIAKWTFLATILAGILLYFITKWLLVPLFGNDYRASLEPMLILIIACSFSGYARVIANALAAKNKPILNLYIGLFAAFTNVILNLLLIPKFGLMGAAYATCFSFGINFLLKIFAYIYIYKTDLGSLISFSLEYSYLKKYLTKYN